MSRLDGHRTASENLVSRPTARASSVFALPDTLQGGLQAVSRQNFLVDSLLHRGPVGKALKETLDEVIEGISSLGERGRYHQHGLGSATPEDLVDFQRSLITDRHHPNFLRIPPFYCVPKKRTMAAMIIVWISSLGILVL